MVHSYPPAKTLEDYRRLSESYGRTIIEQAEEIRQLKMRNNEMEQKLKSKKGNGDGR